MGKGCTNSRTIVRDVLETRVLAGLQDRLMEPEAFAEAMRSFIEETNRLRGGDLDVCPVSRHNSVMRSARTLSNSSGPLGAVRLRVG